MLIRAGSTPVTRTISSVHNISELWTLDFFLLLFTFSLIFSLIFDFFEQFFCSFFLFAFVFVLLFAYIAVGRYSIATPCLDSSF